MSKPKKSARILELQGAYKKDPQRKNHDEPEVKPLTVADVPALLTEHERECFIKLMSVMPAGVYSVAEIPMLELAAKLQSESQLNWAEFPAPKMGHLIKVLCQLGMTPGERTRLVQPKVKPGNKFD
jgi:hypothetical protein